MQVLDHDTKFAHLGKPGEIFSAGFQRRLNKLTKLIDLRDKKILDVGCGEGVWLEKFTEFTTPEYVYGTEYDHEQVVMLKQSDSAVLNKCHIPTSNIEECGAEQMPFPNDMFDIVFCHEVLEHVQDDQQSVNEMVRVLKPGGKLIIFTPNRAWPFEQHGMFWRGKYYWGNIPLLPWLPFLYKYLAPHVRNYSNRKLESLFKGLQVKIIYHKHVFPGFDGAVRRLGFVGKLIQWKFHLLEKTPLEWFGISHFLILEKS